MKKTWPFTFYVLYFAAFASLLPFFVLFYQSLGFTGAQIGLLAGVSPLITLIATPFGTGLADSTHHHKLIFAVGLGGAIASALILLHVSSFPLVFVLVVLFNFFIAPVASLGDSATMHMLGEQKAMYGRVRLGGTIGWGVFAPIAGALVDSQGLRIVFWVFSIIMLVNILVSQKLSFGTVDEHDSNHGGIRTLLKSHRWIFFLLAAFLGGLGVSSINAYLFPYMAELGANETTMGVALTIATMTELFVFFFGDRLIKRFTAHGLFILAMFMMGIRSLLYAAASTPTVVLVIQLFSGMVFPAMWLAGVSYADENAPMGLKSTAQGLFGAMTFGFGSAVGGFIGGLLLEGMGGRGMFLVFGITILVGSAIIETVRRLLPQRELVRSEV